MEYTRLGRTEIEVSVAGLGCGGFSRLGLAKGASRGEAADLVLRAIDRGVNFLDTAASYGTERIVADAIAARDRSSVIVSTKSSLARGGALLSPEQVLSSLDQSLRELRTDYVDVFHLHGVRPGQIDYAQSELLPVLEKAQVNGKVRALGVTETPPNDLHHVMLETALADPRIEVAMIGFHMLYQSARRKIFPLARAHDVGTLGMFAVRLIFSQPERLNDAIRELAAAGEIPPELADNPDPLDFLVHEGGATSLIDAAYRFVRHDEGIDVVLFGTGVAAHLDTAIESILRPPLPAEDVSTLRRLFGHLDGVGLDAPNLASKQARSA
ncbi:MAG: aldo/keto reductase [Gammaproteobacteria bacterium]|nr:aldo/keto reductase [Gammaproteobacteria bacterium]